MPTEHSPALAPLVACLMALLVAGCSIFAAPSQLRGNKVDADQLKELVPGTSSKADVTALIGSPTARATFDDNTWLYVSEVTHTRIARVQGIESQEVVKLTFNDQGVLRDMKRLNQDDGIPVAMVSRTTPSPGTEASFFQQLFGNIGRFNALGSQQPRAPSGGAPGPAY